MVSDEVLYGVYDIAMSLFLFSEEELILNLESFQTIPGVVVIKAGTAAQSVRK